MVLDVHLRFVFLNAFLFPEASDEFLKRGQIFRLSTRLIALFLVSVLCMCSTFNKKKPHCAENQDTKGTLQ